jgi:hypothetical protein
MADTSWFAPYAVGERFEITPLTHKAKNRVRNHGEFWEVAKQAGRDFLLIPVRRHDSYACWMLVGKDFIIKRMVTNDALL